MRISDLSSDVCSSDLQIVATGRVNSYVTAIALEIATDRQIDADAITTLETKGAQLYRREPARSLLMLSFEQGVSMAGLLRRLGITTADLFAFMNAPEGRSYATKSRVRDVLDKFGISTARTERSAERRVGKECVSRGCCRCVTYHYTNN